MSAAPATGSVQWFTRRSHLQVSKTQVLPVVYKSRNSPNPKGANGPAPRAFPATEVHLSDALVVIRDWLVGNMEKMYRVGAMNVKPGSLETPDVLQTGTHRFTVWFEPTAATFALMVPDMSGSPVTSASGSKGNDDGGQGYEGYVPTPQTLHVVGELDTQKEQT